MFQNLGMHRQGRLDNLGGRQRHGNHRTRRYQADLQFCSSLDISVSLQSYFLAFLEPTFVIAWPALVNDVLRQITVNLFKRGTQLFQLLSLLSRD
jgi:hypothetical protein